MNGLRSAIGFLTILPFAPRGAPVSMASARGWFPLVGLLLGITLAGIQPLLMGFNAGWFGYAPLTIYEQPSYPTFTALLWAVLLVVALVVLTRALHLDGFMDSCDALLGGFDRERRLAILRDPHVGAFAVIGVVCLLIIKVSVLAALPSAIAPTGVWSIKLPLLALFPCLSRWAVLLTMELYPYIRQNGLGVAFFEGGEQRIRWQLILGFAFTLIVSIALAGHVGLILFATACAVAWGIGAWATRLLGGVTGDIYGAVNEVAEVAVLLLALLLASSRFPIFSPLLEALWQSL
ncbi:MAG: adenosylcobinamide-GDP ribazoletransferase [Chloroflexi bacterium]|nr:adenosylcobinamide-GDP ribazoletransferase [Chloroflexota bacterium]